MATATRWRFAVADGRYSLDFRVGGTEAVHGGDAATARLTPDFTTAQRLSDVVTGEIGPLA